MTGNLRDATGQPVDLVQPEMTKRLEHTFYAAFTVLDVADTLPVFECGADAVETRQSMEALHHGVAGVYEAGAPLGFVERKMLTGGMLGDHAVPFSDVPTLHFSDPLADAVAVLDASPFAFVTMMGRPQGIVVRAGFDKPAARMWLFGMLTILEMNMRNGIAILFPDDAWQPNLSAGRLAKARGLCDERIRRGVPCDLLDCIQMVDKAHVLLKDDDIRERMGYPSKRAATTVIKALESIRNHIAHSQSVVLHDWDAIVELTSSLGNIIKGGKLSAIIRERQKSATA
jgi:hypothetical protein